MKSILVIILLFIQQCIYCQEILSTAGTNSVSGDLSMSWTLGEAFILTLGNGEIILTQGFQQYFPSVTNIVDNTDYECQVNVFPNPFSDYLRISLEKVEQHSYTYKLTDMHGTVIKQGKLGDNVYEIRTGNLPAAIYILNIVTDYSNIKRIKIIKSNNN